MDRWQGRVAVITGASAGVGAAVCKLLSQNGMKVVGCARRVEKIEALKAECPNLHAYKCDLEKEDEVEAMFKWIESDPNLGRVDFLLANAGMSTPEGLLDGHFANWKKMMDLNVLALCLCTQLALKSMFKHKIDDGQVIFLNSLSGHRVLSNPAIHFYAATKYAVTALLEGWRQEVRAQGDSNIRVAQISPGLIDTEFIPQMYKDHPGKADKMLSATSEPLHAENIAEQVKFILTAPKSVHISDILVRSTQQMT
ncbi:hypothetical protein TCAL_06693 [Tigriopus californicus]|uniref:Dehydrogenase/reductase SDR family member 11 n=1 Tax=Tigriopus californicus TaxID=6832 RepID=A0A553P8L5_TIGCA|nr:dehydrogenase/reductase SDR family member 11-like [Tigriopus californicus]TRY74007.1 hypothetical protein TCAL_06693 [Tigriopus californicus]|eukprot:TCALIF_06693-PA protein Name:"Similar to DHRS11 Dehydrogenase/reductase SDR family member 11 (Gallus gallus)" AED:0.08 eAED:0.08 QI:410/1/1/1/1/1/5/378/253